MVQCMESWFLADIEMIEPFYGQGFRMAALAGDGHVENVRKKDVLDRLREATRHTQKGPYHKTKHAPHLLKKIRPERVKDASPRCQRLFEACSEQSE
jgi:hypothetical protein